MLDFELVKETLIIAIGSSIISTAVIQKIKETLKTKKWLQLIAFLVSMALGMFFTKTFTDKDMIISVWVGICSWVGADALYKAFQDKIFTPFAKMQEAIEVPRENEITFKEVNKDEVQ